MSTKLSLITVSSSKDKWFDEAYEVYQSKIKKMISFDGINLKSSKMERDDSKLKIKKESELILNHIDKSDLVILFDERGKNLNSIEWAHLLDHEIQYSQKNIIFIIGGAFGVDDSIKKRANKTLTLSPFVMNHKVACIVAMEQIYRALTIIKKIPYHNDNTN